MARLKLKHGTEYLIQTIRSDYKLDPKKPTKIGRNSEANIVIPDRSLLGKIENRAVVETIGHVVSREHCEILPPARDEGWSIYDCESRNGTYVNGVKLGRGNMAGLRSGDEINLGGVVTFTFEE